MNTVTVVGNLTRDPELRIFENGTVANLGIAINESYKDKRSDEWKEITTFMNLAVWGEQEADNVVESLKKGDRVLVSGKLKVRQWETDSGEKRQASEISVQEIGPTLKWATTTGTRNAKKDRSRDPSQANF